MRHDHSVGGSSGRNPALHCTSVAKSRDGQRMTVSKSSSAALRQHLGLLLERDAVHLRHVEHAFVAVAVEVLQRRVEPRRNAPAVQTSSRWPVVTTGTLFATT